MNINATIVIESHKAKKSLSMYVKDKTEVNELMLSLMDAGFSVNYEPCYNDANYEGCFLCEDENVIKICCKE